MKYHSKYADTGRYMFPDIAAMSDEETFNTIASRPELTTPFTTYQKPIQDKLEVLSALSASPQPSVTSSLSLIQNYQRLFSGEYAKQINTLIVDVESKLIEQSLLYTEIYTLAQSFINLLKRVDFDSYFDTVDKELEDKMALLEELNMSKSLIDLNLLSKYQNLPILQINEALSDEESRWLIEVYNDAVLSASEILDTQIRYFLLKVKKYEDVRLWYVNTLSQIKNKMEDALFVMGERESVWKHEFFMKQNNFLDGE